MRSMRRHALEVTVQAAFGTLQIVNTHLEYHSPDQREAQIARLLELQQEASTSSSIGFPAQRAYGSQTLAASSVLCGDFNFDVTDRQHAVIDQSARPGLNYRDAWGIRRPGQPRSPTCGLYDHVQWANGGLSRFRFHDGRFGWRIRRIEVNSKTDASDHQLS